MTGAVLAPLGHLYGSIAARRMLQPPIYTASLPVVCVGNFTAGGTGKTPVARHLVEALRAQGHVPVMLSRGYGGTEHGPHRVDPAADPASRVGDEPLLLAQDAPVVVARDRVAGARFIEAKISIPAKPTVIVMDDGLQNPGLAKALRIAVVDAARGVGNGRCMPAGPLRAPLATQLRLVDAVVLNRGDGGRADDASTRDLLRAFRGPVVDAAVTPAEDIAWLAGKRVVAFAGIGVPDRFFSTAAKAGATLVDTIAFPDHHAFTKDDARNLLARAAELKALLLTTEKDLVRLRAATDLLADLAAVVRYLPVRIRLDVTSAARLAELIASRIPLKPKA